MMNDRVILVTGAASGIGAACLRAMAGPGTAFLVHTRRNREGAEAMAGFARARGARAETILADIADPATPDALVAAALAVARSAASACGTRPASSREPDSVATPALSKRSFHETGTPSSAERRAPVRALVRAASASPRARSGVVRA
jgi:NAD(P)-dependent dehydrogenase (short-subunit alcohol dehydrogenase family)